MISDVVDFFDTKITGVDASFQKWAGKFDIDDSARNIYPKSYHIELGDLRSGALRDMHTDDLLNVTVRLFFKAVRDVQTSRSTAYDIANNVRLACLTPVNGTNIKVVTLESMGPETFDSSDYSVVMRLNFTVRLIFKP
jgi:hypothetical protein